MTLTIPIPEKVSLKRIYAGIHFGQRQGHKERYHLAVMAAKPRPTSWTGTFPVAMHYHFRIHGSRLDVSNHAYMLKMVEDGLVACGLLPGDDPKYVSQITITAEKSDIDEVDVTISPVCAS